MDKEMKDKDLRFIVKSFIAIAIVAALGMLFISSCSKEANTVTLKAVVEPMPNTTISFPEYTLNSETFQPLMIKEFNYSFTEVVGKHYSFLYVLDTFDNVKTFKLYEDGHLIGEVSKQGQSIVIKK